MLLIGIVVLGFFILQKPASKTALPKLTDISVMNAELAPPVYGMELPKTGIVAAYAPSEIVQVIQTEDDRRENEPDSETKDAPTYERPE